MVAILLAALWLEQQLPKPPEQEPLAVVIAGGETSEDRTYDPARDQHTLAAPKSWCLTARRNEPLVADARRIAVGKDYPAPGILALNKLEQVSPRRVRVIQTESICEAAAKVFDRAWFGGGDATIEEHTTFEAVLVVEVGPIYVVGFRRQPGEAFMAVALDYQMNEVGSFGQGL